MAAVAVQAEARSATPVGSFQHRIVAASLIPWVGILLLHSADVDMSVGVWVAAKVVLAGHVGATAAFYADREMKPIMRAHPARYYLAPITAIVLAVVLVRWHGTRLVLLFTFLAVWQIHHTTKQHLGMFAFWLKTRNAGRMSGDERRLMQLTTAIGALGISALDVFDEFLPAADALEAIGFGCAVVALVLWIRCRTEDQARNMALLLAVAFYLPLYLISNPVTAGLVFGAAHGVQYLLMMDRVTAARPASRTTGIVVGLAIGLVSVNAGTSSLMAGIIVGAIVAHYVVDAGAWRLSEAPQREYMRRRFDFL